MRPVLGFVEVGSQDATVLETSIGKLLCVPEAIDAVEVTVMAR